MDSSKQIEKTKHHNGPPLGSPNHRLHGLKVAKRDMKRFGNRAIDRRTRFGKALQQWRADIIRDLGGEAVLSAQEHAVLDIVVRLKLMLDSIDAWILEQPSMVHQRKRALLPVIRERNALSDSFVKHLSTLGLKRVTQKIDIVAELAELTRQENQRIDEEQRAKQQANGEDHSRSEDHSQEDE